MSLSLVGLVRSCVKRTAQVAVMLGAVFASGGTLAAALQPSADDYSAISSALAQAEDGGVVELAAGTFMLTNQITLARGVTIRGASRDGTIIDCANKCRGFVLSHVDAKVADLTLYRGKSSNSGGGIYLSNGLVTNCWIKSCVTTISAGGGGGGGVYMTGGSVVGCEFTGCSFSSLYSQGNAICLKGGMVDRCDFHGNDGGYDHTNADYGSHAVYVYSGTLKNSRIHNNETWLAGLKQVGGTVVNCLVYGNKAKYTSSYKPLNGAGVYKTGGDLCYCTIYGNINDNETTGCSGIRQTGGTTRYCISTGNGPSGATRGSNYITGGTFAGNVIDKALSSYSGNLTGDPDFVAAHLADFRIAHPTSPAIGYGSPIDTVPTDLAGNLRDATAPTAGAFEYQHVLVCVPELAYKYETGERLVADVPVCADYEVLANDGGIAPGFYPVRLGLTTAGAHWRDGSSTNKTVLFEIVAQTVLQPTNTYEDIVAAIANVNDGETIRFAPGTYALASTITLARPITLKGDSRDGVIFDFGNRCRGFSITDSDACLRDVTIYRGYATGHGGGVNMTGGMVSNCLIKACTAHSQSQCGGGVYMNRGKLIGCEITQCIFDSLYGHGNAIYLADGTVSGCDIHHNDGGYSHASAYCYGDSVVWVNAGVLEKSRIHHNTKAALPGVRLNSGMVRNCLIYANSGSYLAGGVYQNGGSLLYTTVSGNVINEDVTGISGISMSGGTTKHCISAGNGPAGSIYGSNKVTGGTFVSNIVDVVLASYGDNVAGNPDFVSAAGGDFRIVHPTSPAVGYGRPVSSVPQDFYGNVRSLTAPTAGACEFTGVIVKIPEIPFVYANGERQIADVSDGEDYEVLENEGGTEPGFYPVRVGLTTAGAQWTDGSSANKTLQFQIVASTVLQPTNTYEDIVAAMATVNDGETVFFAPGTYTVTNTISLSRPITLKGTRRDGVILDFGNRCRGFSITHADACLRDVTIYRASRSGDGGGLYISAGLVTNCWIKSCVTTLKGGGAYVAGGCVACCEFSGCSFSQLYGHGNAIYMTSGMVSGCDIHNNDGGYSHSSLYGDSIVYMNGGTLQASKVHHNTKSVLPGVWLNAGTMRNCLVYGNSGNYTTAGIYQTGGTLLYTTVSGNVIKNDTAGISGIKKTSGTTRNSIFYDNGPSGGTGGSCNVSGGTFFTNVIDKALASYPDNRVADPLFYEATSNDYRLATRASAAYAYATPIATVPADIVGFPRDGETPSCGAYEYDRSQEKFGVDIKIVQTDYRIGSTATVEAVVSGAELDEVDIAWYLDGALLEDESAEVLELGNLSFGHHTVKAVVAKKAGGEPVAKEVKDALAVRPLTCYVNQWGTGDYPFATPATATNSINAAVAAVWTDPVLTSTVHVAAGAYTNTATVTVLDKIRILGAGRDTTFVVNASATAFSIANGAAELCDLTVRDSYAGISVSAGRVHDFRLKSISHYDSYGNGAGISVSGSGTRVWNGEIDDCSISGTYCGGGGLALTGGVVSNVVIRRCYGSDSPVHGTGGAVYMSGGTLTRSVIAGMTQVTSAGLAVYATGGTLDHCVVTGNTCTVGGYVVNLKNTDYSSVTARNCLFAFNTQNGESYPSVNLAGGSFVNCTFATNAAPKVTLNASGITACNTIFAEMGGTNVISGTFSHCCAPSLANGVNGNLSAAPRFKNARRGNFRLLRSSPGVDAGDNAVWANYADPTDLDGNPRINRRDREGVVDMGCYENQPTGFLVLVL